jgi:hypothetical protein
MVKTIQVGKNGNPVSKQVPAATPVPKPVREKGLLSKMVDIIKEDRNRATLNIRAIISPPPPGWDEYQQFLELSRKGGK